MWTCPKCNEQHEDSFDSCWKCADASELLEPKDKKPGSITKSIFWLLSIGLTVIGSVIASAFAVGAIIFKGNLGASMGFEFLPCLGAPIPGLIGFYLSKFIFRKDDLYTRSALSAVSGVAFACVAMVSFYSVILAKATHDDQQLDKNTANEMVFFKAALEGKCTDDVIRNHYKDAKFSRYDREREKESKAIQKLLYDKNRGKISSKAISVLIDVLKSDVLVVGYLADQPETPIEVKKKIAESPDEYAVLPMSENPDTPQDILKMLAMHNELSVAGRASSNKNAPPYLTHIYTIHYLYQYPDTVGYANTPRLGLNKKEELIAWKTLSNNKQANIRTWVASNDMAPKNILAEMANDSSEDVLGWLILNNSTPNSVKQKIAGNLSSSIEEIISHLANSQDQRVRFGVAQCNVASPQILAGLWKNSNDMVRVALADNPKTPIETLKILSTDFGKVKETATKALYRREHKL